MFQDHVIAAALLDRILHRCTTVNIRGELSHERPEKAQIMDRAGETGRYEVSKWLAEN
ncbi:ATP-binding protein [Methanoculleus frigidifontis]|uniref:ATP-binding protein n=1 Tax=Methanoculleus frigidifontis TaxID=2584085 RepID=UPI003F5B60D8